MRRRTVLALAATVAILTAVALFGLGATLGGSLDDQWASETPRENTFNHHAVGVGPEGEVVVAPVAETPGSDVTLTDDSCSLVRLAPGNGSTRWQTGMPAEDCFTHALTEPAIADVDRDGEHEVVVASTEDAVVAYAASNGTEEWRAPLSTYGYGRPAVANVTGGPGPEVVTADISGNLTVVHGNGSVAWRFDAEETGWARTSVWDAPTVEDVDADGEPEILLGSNRGSLLLSADGSVEWQQNGTATYTATARIDDDPAVEVFASGSSSIRAYDGRTGELEWQRDLTNVRIRTAADADGDGAVELYVGRFGGKFLALDGRSGETEWATTVSRSDDVIAPPPVLGDVDGDGGPEVVGALESGTVAVLDPDTGAELALYERNVPVWTFPTVRDVDGDGAAEILVRYGDGRVVALEYSS